MGNWIPRPTTASEIWSFVTEIGKAERDFNSLQAGYRKLASTWFIAVFGGLGFLLKPVELPGGEVRLGFEEPLLVIGLGVAGYIGILVLWLVDIAVYHRLLLAYFQRGQELEKTHTWLPQVRHGMVGVRAIKFATLFYVGLATAAFVGPTLSVLALKWEAVSLQLLIVLIAFVAFVVGLDGVVVSEARRMREEVLGTK